MKKIAATLIAVAALVIVPSAVAATGSGTASTPIGAVTVATTDQQAAVGTVALDAPALNADYNILPDGSPAAPINVIDQPTWSNMLCNMVQIIEYPQGGPTVCNQDGTFQPSPDQLALLETDTVACVDVKLVSVSIGSLPSWATAAGFPWACGQYTSSLATGFLADYMSIPTVGSISAWPAQRCSWLQAYDPASGACGGPGSTPGKSSGISQGPPSLDSLVGKIAVFQARVEYCSYLAPAGMDVAANIGANVPFIPIGCGGQTSSTAIGGAARTMASTTESGRAYASNVSVKIRASASDCHVPKVKGLSLKRAERRLLTHNCRARVRYAPGKVSGRVKYQPLPVGTGRPRGYRVKLTVSR